MRCKDTTFFRNKQDSSAKLTLNDVFFGKRKFGTPFANIKASNIRSTKNKIINYKKK